MWKCVEPARAPMLRGFNSLGIHVLFPPVKWRKK